MLLLGPLTIILVSGAASLAAPSTSVITFNITSPQANYTTTCPVTKPAPGSGKLKFTGVSKFVSALMNAVNLTLGWSDIAGFDFGCDTTGNCSYPNNPPLLQYGGGDGKGQMQHFVSEVLSPSSPLRTVHY